MKKLEENALAVWGNKGKSWLGSLPEIIDHLASKWGLSEISPVSNMSYNYVAKATQKNQAVVLKISCDEEFIDSEFRALKHFDVMAIVVR